MKDERLANDLLRGMKNEIRRLELLVNDLSLLRGSGDPTVLYIIRSVNTSEWLTELALSSLMSGCSIPLTFST